MNKKKSMRWTSRLQNDHFFFQFLVNSLAFRIYFIFSFVPRNDVVYVIPQSLARLTVLKWSHLTPSPKSKIPKNGRCLQIRAEFLLRSTALLRRHPHSSGGHSSNPSRSPQLPQNLDLTGSRNLRPPSSKYSIDFVSTTSSSKLDWNEQVARNSSNTRLSQGLLTQTPWIFLTHSFCTRSLMRPNAAKAFIRGQLVVHLDRFERFFCFDFID